MEEIKCSSLSLLIGSNLCCLILVYVFDDWVLCVTLLVSDISVQKLMMVVWVGLGTLGDQVAVILMLLYVLKEISIF